ncbi:MAG: RnfABCDGE type electron transport complex subunit B [Defluviitaleaceae bacterium]|nr:RnfABCDGE type electron transport complex subunit B [Defluviitaleaceae bacterium]
MDYMSILSPVLVIGGMGLVFGLALGFAGKIFYVKEDERVVAVSAALPGVNCGACGYAGCGAFAKAVVQGAAKGSQCPVADNGVLAEIAGIMGTELEIGAKTAAFVKCGGGHSNSEYRYDYQGLDDCRAAMLLTGGGSKSCKYGCLGNSSCVRVCPFGAIDMVNGIAVINEKCTSCGLCVPACPRDLIAIVPAEGYTRVACNSHDMGRAVRDVCQNGCISCRLCMRACADEAIVFEDSLATVNYEKCTQCGLCVEKCPTKCIISTGSPKEKETAKDE